MAFKILKDKPEVLQNPVEEPVRRAENKQIYKVVAKLPVQEVRRYQEDDGTIVNLITIEEALTAIANGE